MEKILLTPVEAAAVLGIGRTKLYELLRTGRLGSIRIGTSRRIPRGAVDALVADLWTGVAIHRSAGGDPQLPAAAIASTAGPAT